jgi:hypothetical protein
MAGRDSRSILASIAVAFAVLEVSTVALIDVPAVAALAPAGSF